MNFYNQQRQALLKKEFSEIVPGIEQRAIGALKMDQDSFVVDMSKNECVVKETDAAFQELKSELLQKHDKLLQGIEINNEGTARINDVDVQRSLIVFKMKR